MVDYKWINLHVYFTVDASPDAKSGRMEVQMKSIPALSREGWSQNSIAIGEQVVVEAHPGTVGRNYAVLISMQKKGKPYPKNS